MNAKEAIKTAKIAFAELFSDEPIQNLGLEEIELDHLGNWQVTLGFHRTLITNDAFGMSFPTDRIYKVISIANGDGRVLSVKNREVAQA